MRIETYKNLPEQAIEIRQKVFVEEQGFQDEFDETDSRAVHIVLFDGEKPVGTCRVFYDNSMDAYAIGRLAVLKEYRGQSAGTSLVEAAEEHVAQEGGTGIVLHAQERAMGFYQRLGFRQFGDVEDVEGCPHVWMEKRTAVQKPEP